jgi:synaptosomal-associated protein 25
MAASSGYIQRSVDAVHA